MVMIEVGFLVTFLKCFHVLLIFILKKMLVLFVVRVDESWKAWREAVFSANP